MNSEWWRHNILEPDEGLLLQFMTYDTAEARWKCCFWEAGKPCPRSSKGKDHAKGHVRFHIQHSPFACEPPWSVPLLVSYNGLYSYPFMAAPEVVKTVTNDILQQGRFISTELPERNALSGE